MKTKSFISRISITIFTFVFFSCTNLIDTKKETTKATISISVENVARTILAENNIKLEDMSFSLSGTVSGAEEKILGEWDSYSNMASDTEITIDIGIWNFTLSAKKDDITLYSSTIKKVIEAGENILNFELKENLEYYLTGTGNAEVILYFLANTDIKEVKAGLLSVSTRTEITNFGLTTLEIKTESGNNSGKNYVTYTAENIPSGSYILQFKFYKHNGEENKNRYEEIIQIKNGRISKTFTELNATIDKYHNITYKNIDNIILADGYTLPLGFSESDSLSLPTTNDFSREGYTFLGWYATEDFSDSKIWYIAPNTTKDLILWAKWKEITKITYKNIDDAILTDGYDLPIVFTENDVVTLPTEEDISRTGYNFDGWYLKEDLTGAKIQRIPSGTTECITVYAKWDEILVSEIVLSNDFLWLTFNEDRTLFATVYPYNALNKDITWISSDPNIAIVDETGKITALKTGNVEITANAGTATSACKVSVSDIVLSSNKLICVVGDTAYLTANKTVDWISNDETIATVDSNGNIICRNLGRTKIMAKSGDEISVCDIIVFPESLTRSSFRSLYPEYSTIKELEIPLGVTFIEEGTLFGCSAIERLYFSTDSFDELFGYFFGQEEYDGSENIEQLNYYNETHYYRYNCYIPTSLKSIVITGGTSIPKSAFYNCSNIEEILLPNQMSTIEIYAFKNCTNLSRITIPHSVTSIGSYAFNNCDKLTNVTFNDNVISIGTEAFYDCEKLEDIYYTGSLENWLKSSFGDNFVINNFYINGELPVEFVIPEGIETIKDCCFAGFKKLKSVIIPNSVTKIGISAFNQCSNLETILIPNSVIEIGAHAFQSCESLSNIVIPSSVNSIGVAAFKWCSNLKDIEIPNGIDLLDKELFSGCSNLISIAIPDSVTTIGNETFNNCLNLRNIIIPSSVTNIGYNAFGSNYTDNYKNITLLSEIPPTIYYSSFSTKCEFYVPTNAVFVYRGTDGWIDFAKHIHPISEE